MDTTFHPSNPLPCFSGVIAPEFVLSWIQQNPSPQGLRRRCGGRFGRRFLFMQNIDTSALAAAKAKLDAAEAQREEVLLLSLIHI